jgi:sulfur-oxidizing protein SoxY
MTRSTDDAVLGRRGFGALAGAAVLGLGISRAFADDPGATPDPWPVLRQQIFGTKKVGDGSALLSMDAPYRALDAAIVPISIDVLQGAGKAGKIDGLTLVIDQNPSPLAARFDLGKDNVIDRLTTRVRVDDYTNVRAIATLDDGTLEGVKRFVKAAGGCSAPTAKAEATDIPLGTMRFRQFPTQPGSNLAEAQLIIRHPNNSGMQMNQLTMLYIPAHYITSVKVYQGDSLLFSAETGISISQNPDFRFRFRPNGAKTFRAEATDNKGGHFHREWPAQVSS